MSKDPFLEREAEKYESPIPSREFILSHLAKRKMPASREELAQELNISGEKQLEALRRRLRAMERDAQLIFTHSRQCYNLPEHLDLLHGTVIGHREGFGFLRVENGENDYYLSATQMKMVIHGDIVTAQPQGIGRKGRQEARIIQILVPKNSQIIGRFFVDTNSAFVIPNDNRLNFNILIPSEATLNAKVGSVVVIELTQRPTRRTKATGKVLEVLGENMDINIAVNVALRTYNLPYLWPPKVKQQIASLKKEVPEHVKIGRIDLRELPLVTIDGEDALDFDDVVYCEKKHGGGWRLWVAIADVSYYVRPHTPLDNEAHNRATSVYFPSQVIPMLPEVLSNGLCSLNPQVDRLCMVCEMTISTQGRLSSYKFYEAVINSYARLTYSKVWKMLQGNKTLCKNYSLFINPLTHLHEMYKTLEQARGRRGGISVETKDAKFIFNAERRIERIEPIKRNEAHKLIEECMILANIAAARFIEKHKEPALYRVHDRPSNEHITSLRSALNELGLTLGGGDKPQPKDYADMMNQVAGRPDHEMLQTMLLRSMKQAIYDPENRGHFGLALQSYAHFTSPIRRYPDLLLHRTIKYLLGKQTGKVDCRATPTGGWHYELEEMLQLGQQCSMSERRAEEATRDVADWLKCDFMQDHVGEMFSGIITSVTNFGFFVRLNELCIDGLVHISSLNNDYYRYDHITQRLIGESVGTIYRLGDIVKIRVDAVHIDERKINFSLISNCRQLQAIKNTKQNRQKQLPWASHDNKSLQHRHSGKLPANFIPNTFRTPKDKNNKLKRHRQHVNAQNITKKSKGKAVRTAGGESN